MQVSLGPLAPEILTSSRKTASLKASAWRVEAQSLPARGARRCRPRARSATSDGTRCVRPLVLRPRPTSTWTTQNLMRIAPSALAQDLGPLRACQPKPKSQRVQGLLIKFACRRKAKARVSCLGPTGQLNWASHCMRMRLNQSVFSFPHTRQDTCHLR